jgi:hypothetical protein
MFGMILEHTNRGSLGGTVGNPPSYAESEAEVAAVQAENTRLEQRRRKAVLLLAAMRQHPQAISEQLACLDEYSLRLPD